MARQQADPVPGLSKDQEMVTERSKAGLVCAFAVLF